MAIDLKEGSSIPWGPLYSLSEAELKVLKDYLDENLRKGYIRPSKASVGSSLFFVKKKDGTLRPVIDYRSLNNITIKNRYPLPLISELISNFKGSSWFTKIDLRGAYNLVRIKPGDEWKTTFRCRYGQFEYLVMPFGLTNAPSVFQALMNDVFSDLLDIVCVIYLDDILIFSKTLEEHHGHVTEVLRRLTTNSLYAKLEKCIFHVHSVDFLGYIVSDEGLSMDPKRVESIANWKAPSSVKEVQIFLGFANFYRSFIEGYSRVCLPITNLLKKDQVFSWTKDCQNSFDLLKKNFSSAPLLVHADSSLPFLLETDASDFAISGILSQEHEGSLRPVAFYSRKMSPPEMNYEIHDKELLAIIACLAQ
jgi:hypothetical protein